MCLNTDLQARLTALSLVTESLLDTLISIKLIDPMALTHQLEAFIDAPKAAWIPPAEAEEVLSEINAWLCTINNLTSLVRK